MAKVTLNPPPSYGDPIFEEDPTSFTPKRTASKGGVRVDPQKIIENIIARRKPKPAEDK